MSNFNKQEISEFVLKVKPIKCKGYALGCLGLFIPTYKGQRKCIRCKKKLS